MKASRLMTSAKLEVVAPMDGQLHAVRQRHAALWRQGGESKGSEVRGVPRPEGEGPEGYGRRWGSLPPSRSRGRRALGASCIAAVAALTRPGGRSFIRFLRRHGASGPLGWLPVADRLAGLHNCFLFSVAQAGGVSYIGLFGTWVPLALPGGWFHLQLPGRAQHDIVAFAVAYLLVFLAWRQGKYAAFLCRHFLLSSEAHTRRRPWTLVGACFSHKSRAHLLHNTAALFQQAPVLQGILGRQHFLAFYLLTGVAANAGSLLLRRFWLPSRHRAFSSSLGASGSLYAVFSALAVAQPWRKYVFMGVTLTSTQLLVAHLAVDAVFRAAEGIDIAAHACGAFVGALWMLFRR